MFKKIPFLLAILGIVGGVFIAILFAVNEEMFENRIHAGLEKNEKIQQIQDPAKRAEKTKSEADKNWRYYQRFHFHATGISAMMLGLLLFLRRLKAPPRLTTIASYAVALGGFA